MMVDHAHAETIGALLVAQGRRDLRPVSIVALSATGIEPDEFATRVAGVLRESDAVALLPEGLVLALLPRTPENGAIWACARIARTLSAPGVVVHAGVAVYPAHGFDWPDLRAQAMAALEAAAPWVQDRIEVAAA